MKKLLLESADVDVRLAASDGAQGACWIQRFMISPTKLDPAPEIWLSCALPIVGAAKNVPARQAIKVLL